MSQRAIAGAYPGVEYQLGVLKYPLTQLEEYFIAKGTGRLNANDAEIFTSFLDGEVAKMRDMASELDEEYATDPE